MRHLVASGGMPAGAAVPSVRDLARALRVNPATVSKAYQRLTDAGVLAVRRGDGTYVAESPPALPAQVRRERLREGAVRYASLAATLGASADEVAVELAAAWAGLARSHAGQAAAEKKPAGEGEAGGQDTMDEEKAAAAERVRGQAGGGGA